MLLALALGYPFLVLILKLAAWLGAAWWFWAWVCLAAFQLVMLVVAPVLIMPLFNKFTPLPDGGLRDCLAALLPPAQMLGRAVIGLEPGKGEMRRVDELRDHPHAVPGLLNAALHLITHRIQIVKTVPYRVTHFVPFTFGLGLVLSVKRA